MLLVECRWNSVDADQGKLSHGHFVQVRLRSERLLAAHRRIPTQVRHHSPRRPGHPLLLRVQSARPDTQQPARIPHRTLSHPRTITPLTRGLNLPHQTRPSPQTDLRLQSHRRTTRCPQTVTHVLNRQTYLQLVELRTAV